MKEENEDVAEEEKKLDGMVPLNWLEPKLNILRWGNVAVIENEFVAASSLTVVLLQLLVSNKPGSSFPLFVAAVVDTAAINPWVGAPASNTDTASFIMALEEAHCIGREPVKLFE